MANTQFRPMPIKHGFGITSNNSLPGYITDGLRHEVVGRNHNYHFTREKHFWPEKMVTCAGQGIMIDGFSPNLNKSLHVGHLRNLAVATSYSRLLPHARMLSLLGASLGVKSFALNEFEQWCDFLNYRPTLHYDVLMPDDLIACRRQTVEDDAESASKTEEERPWVWDGPKGSVIVKRADGRPLYAYYDLVFREWVGKKKPIYYVTGNEQKQHFQSLGLEEYHLPMGLVLGTDGKKMKSREGTALSATEAISMIEKSFDPPIESELDRRRLAWNVLAWNFLSVSRSTDVKFDPEKWARVDSPGMYITYTETRISSALKGCKIWAYDHNTINELTDEDLSLLGITAYGTYWQNHAVEHKDVAGMANYAHDLARMLNAAYERESIREGRQSFVYTIHRAMECLRFVKWKLGMFGIDKI